MVNFLWKPAGNVALRWVYKVVILFPTERQQYNDMNT